MPSHYDILGVPQDANETDIKKAYRALSLKYHPDRNPDPAATEKYKEINEAHEILSDAQKREQYNMELKFGKQGPMSADGMGDIFNMMFGGGFPGGGFPGGGFPGGGGFPPGVRVFHMGGDNPFGGGGGPFGGGFGGGPFGGGPFGGGPFEELFQQMQKPPVIVKKVSITFEQAYHGGTIQIEIERQVCRNQLRYQEISGIEITIPQGIDEGETIVLRNQGHSMAEGMSGDVKLNFTIQNTSIFTRAGLDLLYQKKISLKESLCGFSFEIHHINGKLLNMNTNTTVIRPHFKKVVPGLGFIKNGQTGNLVLEFDVEFPDTLTKEQIDALREIL